VGRLRGRWPAPAQELGQVGSLHILSAAYSQLTVGL
jgi:hypothetical protein